MKSRKSIAANAKKPKTKGSRTLEEAPAPRVVSTPGDRLAILGKLGAPKGWKPADEVFDHVKAVRTIFPSYNRATRVGGHPVRRIATIHGKSHGGKTAFALGLLRSFVDAGHLGAYVDAEHATPKGFLVELLRDLKELPNFYGKRPENYEETMDGVDELLALAAKAVALDPDICSAILVDSMSKLVPKRELKNVREKGSDELAKGHLGRARAAMNQAWLDHLVPMLGKGNCGLILIAQEREVASDNSKFEPEVEIKGGQALRFDASIVARVLKSSPVREGTDTSSPIVGFKHRVRIWKSKVNHMDGRYTDCFFHLSNGVLEGVPAGFDQGRDLLEVGKDLGVVHVNGSWVSWARAGGKKIRKQGFNSAVQFLAREEEERAFLFEAVHVAIEAERRARGGVQDQFDPSAG